MSNIYVDKTTGKMQQGQSGLYDTPIADYRPGEQNPPEVQQNTPPRPSADPVKFTYLPDGSRVPKTSAVDNYWANNKPLSADEIAAKDSATKSEYANRMRDSIAAINNMYTSVIARANQQGQNRLGSTNVINALSGQRGSASGAANVDNMVSANNADLKAIDDEKTLKIQETMNKYTKDQQDELRYQNELRQKNTEGWLAYMGQKETENKLNSKAMRSDLLKSGVRIEEIAPDTLQKMAEAGGYSVDQFKLLYERDRKKLEQDFADAELTKLADLENKKADTEYKKAQTGEIGKQKPMEVSPGSSIFDPVSGKFIGTAPQKPADPANPKDSITTVGNSLLQYDSTTGTWKNIYTAPTDGKPLTTAEKLALAEKGYEIGANGELVKTTIPDVQKIAAASDMVSSIDDLMKINGGNPPTGLGGWNKFIPETDASNFEIKLESIIGGETLKNMGLIKGVLSDSDMKLLKSASTGGLNMKLSPDLFKEQIQRIRNSAVSVINAPKMQTNDVLDNGDGTYSYKNNDGTVHTGKKGDGYKDNTVKTSSADESGGDELDAALKKAGFSGVGGDTNKAVSKAIEKPDGEKGGQCGAFVNRYTGLGLGDTYQSKISKMDPTITQPEPGMVFTMPYKDTGHTGFIIGIEGNDAIVKDSNFSLNGEIKTHKIPIEKMTGFARVG